MGTWRATLTLIHLDNSTSNPVGSRLQRHTKRSGGVAKATNKIKRKKNGEDMRLCQPASHSLPIQKSLKHGISLSTAFHANAYTNSTHLFPILSFMIAVGSRRRRTEPVAIVGTAAHQQAIVRGRRGRRLQPVVGQHRHHGYQGRRYIFRTIPTTTTNRNARPLLRYPSPPLSTSQ